MDRIEAMRVFGGGGGRGPGLCLRGCLTQRDELQGRVRGPAHQLAKRALVLATFDHRREHVFVRLRVGSDGIARNVRDRGRPLSGSHGAEPNPPRGGATDLAPALRGSRDLTEPAASTACTRRRLPLEP